MQVLGGASCRGISRQPSGGRDWRARPLYGGALARMWVEASGNMRKRVEAQRMRWPPSLALVWRGGWRQPHPLGPSQWLLCQWRRWRGRQFADTAHRKEASERRHASPSKAVVDQRPMPDHRLGQGDTAAHRSLLAVRRVGEVETPHQADPPTLVVPDVARGAAPRLCNATRLKPKDIQGDVTPKKKSQGEPGQGLQHRRRVGCRLGVVRTAKAEICFFAYIIHGNAHARGTRIS